MKILVTGANGQLGSELRAIAPDFREHEFHFFGSKEVDITDATSVSAAFSICTPDIVINCAAYTAVDQAEDESDEAFAVNVIGVKNLVENCIKGQSKLIHISTDYVFNGEASSPYTVGSETEPIGVYGRTKREGEEIILNSNLPALIIRTSWVFSSFGKNFLKTMLRLGNEKESLNVVSDQYGCPTYAYDLAQAINEIINSNRFPNHPMVFHYCNNGVTNWFEFATEIMNLAHLNCNVHPIPTSEYPTKAKRPGYSVLDNSAIAEYFDLQIRNWREALQEAIDKLNS